MKSFLIVLLLPFFFAIAGYAQPEIFKKIQKANPMDNIQYNYSIRLYNNASHKVTDSIRGTYIKYGNNFRDSSKSSLSMLSGKYFCSIDKVHKEVNLYDIDVLQKKLGLEREKNTGQGLLDSLYQSFFAVNIDSTAKDLYKITSKTRKPPYSKYYIEVLRKNYAITKILIEQPDDNTQKGYTRICQLNNLKKSTTPPDPHTVFSLQGTHATLNKKYTGYTLNSLLD